MLQSLVSDVSELAEQAHVRQHPIALARPRASARPRANAPTCARPSASSLPEALSELLSLIEQNSVLTYSAQGVTPGARVCAWFARRALAAIAGQGRKTPAEMRKFERRSILHA